MNAREMVELLGSLNADMVRYAVSILNEKDHAQDVVQQVALRLLSREEAVEVENGRAYIVAAVRMVALDMNRARNQIKAGELVVDPAAPEAVEVDEAKALLASEEIQSALQHFRADTRDEVLEMVNLHYVGGKTIAEVAATFGMGVEAVKQRMRRFRERLRG